MEIYSHLIKILKSKYRSRAIITALISQMRIFSQQGAATSQVRLLVKKWILNEITRLYENAKSLNFYLRVAYKISWLLNYPNIQAICSPNNKGVTSEWGWRT